jgi:hypothetical protein
MPATRARTHGDTVEIPGELHDALGQPRRIVLTPAADSSIMLRGQRLRNRLGEPVRKLVGRDAGSFVAKLRRAGDPAAFTTRMPLSDAEYGIANYDVYPPDDYRSTGLASFSHALLVARLGA